MTPPADLAPERWLCLRCSQWFPADEELKACPGCGARGVPASSRDIVSISITWHELRVLVIWAEQWANRHREKPEGEGGEMAHIIYGIADRISSQHLGKPGLTLASEIAELRSAFGPNNIETNIPDGPPEDSP